MAENGKTKPANPNGASSLLGRLRIRPDDPRLAAPTSFDQKIKGIRRCLNLVLLFALALIASVLLVPIEDVYTAQGLVRPKNIVHLYAATDLEQRQRPTISEGDHVQKGQILSRFHLPEHEKEILQIREMLTNYKADLLVQEARTAALEKQPLPKELWEITEQLAKSRSNRQYYKSQLTRAEELAKSGDISAQEVESARLQHDQAEIEHERLKQRFELVDTGYSDTLVEQARAEEARIAQRIDNTTARLALLEKEFQRLSVLYAPADGVILEIPYKNVIGIINKGEELVYMASGDDRVIQILGPQENFDKVHIGQKVRYKSRVYDAMNVDYAEGSVFRISQTRQPDFLGDDGNSQERYYSILASIDKQPKRLQLDSNVTAQVILAKHCVAKMLFGLND